MDHSSTAGEVTELLQQLIQNKCVNEDTPESGYESRNAYAINDYLKGSGLDVEMYEALPDRASLVARMEGTDPSAPTLLLLGHTDVVPVSSEGWTVDPFEGKFDGDRIWGRGAIDMLNIVSSMAVAMKHMAEGERPRATIVFAAVADEEGGGDYGAVHLLEHHREAVQADYVITESGGVQLPTPSGPRLAVTVGEKGFFYVLLRIKGMPGHSSMPLKADNAIVTAGKVLHRINEHHDEPLINNVWRRFISDMDFDDNLRDALLDPSRFDEAVHDVPYELGPRMHACAHMTVTPTIINGGTKGNTIPDLVEIKVNIRTLMGQTESDIRTYFADVLGDLSSRVEISIPVQSSATESPIESPMWNAMAEVSKSLVPGAVCVPSTTAGGTDAYHFRKAGMDAYGFGLFSNKMTYKDFIAMFHGNDEWVDQQSLLLSTQLWMGLAHAL